MYEENVQRHLTEALIARTRELETRLAVYEGQSPAPSPETGGLCSTALSAPCVFIIECPRDIGTNIQADDPIALPQASSSTLPFNPDDIDMFDITSPGGSSYTLALPEQAMFPEGSDSSSMASSSRSAPVSLQELSD